MLLRVPEAGKHLVEYKNCKKPVMTIINICTEKKKMLNICHKCQKPQRSCKKNSKKFIKWQQLYITDEYCRMKKNKNTVILKLLVYIG